ncbi:glycosyltransferase [Sphingomonas sp. NCPPB 2930]
MKMPRICLNMIVKNEAPVIARCLASVLPYIDHWVIVDTGSTDGTQDVVRNALQGVPGDLYERPWKNFSHNRNEALELARHSGDYLLFIDADEQLQMPQGFGWPPLSADGYLFTCCMDGHVYQRNSLVATRVPWRWEGVLHEYLTAPAHGPWHALPGAVIQVSHDGARARDPQTYRKDIGLLEQALREAPGNTRYAFYLAQSMRDAGMLQESREAYRKRVLMGGWDEECWYAQFQVAVLTERLGEPAPAVRDAFLTAYSLRPTRAEPLCALAKYHRLRSEFALAHLFAQQAASLPQPADILFVDTAVYTWRALDELAVSAFYANAKDQGRAALERLLREMRYPPSEAARIEANRPFFGL